MSILELTCPFDSLTDLTIARQRKEGKPEYQQIIGHLGFVSQYYTVEIAFFGHYLNETITAMKNMSNQKLTCKIALKLIPLNRETYQTIHNLIFR